MDRHILTQSGAIKCICVGAAVVAWEVGVALIYNLERVFYRESHGFQGVYVLETAFRNRKSRWKVQDMTDGTSHKC